MIKSKKRIFDLFIVLYDLTAEGCPILALNLIDELKKKKINILVLTFKDNNNELLDEFKKRKITVVSYKLSRSGFYRYFKILFLTYILCKKFNPNSILCFPLGWHCFVAIGSKLAGVKNLCTHAGNLAPERNSDNYLKFKLLIRMGNLLTNKIICCSKYIEDSVIKNFKINKSKSTFIYNCYDEEKFKFINNLKTKSKIKNQKIINIGMVGRLEAHKDQNSLIKAIKILKKRNINANLFLIGDGQLFPILLKITKKLNLTKQVQFLGSRNDVEELLNKLDIFVFSTTKDEGFGIAMVEAMGKGLPIIASDVGACREILQDGKYGNLVTPNSDTSIANSIQNILFNIDEEIKKRYSTHKYVIKNFSKKRMAENYINELELFEC